MLIPVCEGATASALAAHDVQLRCARAYYEAWEFHHREVIGEI
jgi:hypothetical protein